MYLCDKGSILVLPIEYVKKIIKERMFIMNSKNKKIIKCLSKTPAEEERVERIEDTHASAKNRGSFLLSRVN